MPKVLTPDQCAAFGVKFGGRVMENGEMRFSANFANGSDYIQTVMAPDQQGAWQNSHYHGGRILLPGEPPLAKGIIELIIVHSGWVAAADLLPDGTRMLNVYSRGEMWISRPGIPHNVYQRGVTHCIKYGEPVGNPEKNGADWWPAPQDFDDWTKTLTEDAIFQFAKKVSAA